MTSGVGILFAAFGDLIAAWTDAGAEDLELWAAAWLQTSGLDTLDVTAPPVHVVRAAAPGGANRRHVLSVGSVDASGALTGLADPGPFDELSALVLDAAADHHGVDADPVGSSAWFSRTVHSVDPTELPVD